MQPPILRVRDLGKRYGDNAVLEGVDLDVARTSVVGIVGENGAGKSTLFNILSGIIRPDRGRIELDGQEVRPSSYREATRLGISRVFQEQALVPSVPVYENLLLGNEDRFVRLGQLLDRRRMIEVARGIVDELELDVDVRRATSDYDFSTRQAIEIARACLVPLRVLGITYPVVLLDEPTAALSRSDEARLFGLIERLRKLGSVLFVSHRLTEVLKVSDIVHVLKDGRLVASLDPADADEHRLHSLMVGRERDADYYQESAQRGAGAAPRLRVRALAATGRYDAVDLDVAEGEIVGIGGLLGSGKAALGRGIAGIEPPDSGTVQLDDGPPQLPELAALVSAGLGYLPAERLAEGLIPAQPVSWNISLAGGRDVFGSALGLWRRRLERETAERFIAELAIRSARAEAPCDRLSGGNQQKVALARWLCRPLRVLILDNPTRGVDAGAKEEIYRVLRKLTQAGVAIVLITDELMELIGLSDRIAIMGGGRLVAMLDASPGAKPTERELVALMHLPAAGQLH